MVSQAGSEVILSDWNEAGTTVVLFKGSISKGSFDALEPTDPLDELNVTIDQSDR